MKVTHYHRRPVNGSHSIERLFAAVRKALPQDVSCSVSISRYPSKGFFPRLLNSLEAALRQGDVNHITGDIHYVSIFLRKRKTILTIHDCETLERLHGIRKKVLYFFWYWLPAKRSALITVVSESTKKEIIRYIPCDPGRIRVIPNCVPAGFASCPREFNFVNPRILQVGIKENKNLIRLAAALDGIACHLRIIGKLSLEQTAALDRYKIDYTAIGEVSDEELIRNYKDCDMVVFASTYEGFGLPIVEANVIGRPVVTGNILSMPEVAGDAACLVDPFDVTSIRAGILRVIEDSSYREELIRKGFRNADRFKAPMVAAQYAKVYKEILSAS